MSVLENEYRRAVDKKMRGVSLRDNCASKADIALFNYFLQEMAFIAVLISQVFFSRLFANKN
jgi:hypothetical protein